MNVDCDLWSLPAAETESRFGACLPDLHLSPLLVVRVGRGAQSTVDGFYGTHTKNSPTALNVRRGTPGGLFGHKGALLLRWQRSG